MIFLFNWVIFRFHVNFQGCKLLVPSRKLTYPTFGKGKSSTQKCRLGGDMSVPRRVWQQLHPRGKKSCVDFDFFSRSTIFIQMVDDKLESFLKALFFQGGPQIIPTSSLLLNDKPLVWVAFRPKLLAFLLPSFSHTQGFGHPRKQWVKAPSSLQPTNPCLG